jgi:hypothetical protein
MDEWYSAMLSFIVEVDGEPEVQRSRSVVLMRGPEFDFTAAKALAIARGRAMETVYTNERGSRVTWSLEKVETIDLLGPHLTAGREVYHEFSGDFPRTKVSFPLDPDSFHPAQSGV